MPELITGVSSVALVGSLDLAFGDIMGSCVFNLMILALMDPLNGKTPLFNVAGRGHVLSASFSVLLIGVAAVSISLAAIIPTFFHISLSTPVIFFIYVVGMRSLYKYEKVVIDEFVSEAAEQLKYKDIGLNKAIALFVVNALCVIVAAIAALRLGALDMAIANMFGSNMFNIMVLGVDDLFFTGGSVFADVSRSHIVTAMIAVVMTSIAVIALIYRQTKSALMRFGWGTFSILVIGLLNFVVLYMMR
jgi:cation:H+ antiporter